MGNMGEKQSDATVGKPTEPWTLVFFCPRGFPTLQPCIFNQKLSLRRPLLGFVLQKYAYPADELMPLSCRGRVRGQEPNRGDIDDSLGK